MDMKITQVERVANYIEEFGSINPLQALGDLGIMRLASRISDLKRMGVPIKKKMVEGRNRFGEKVCFAEYSFDNKEVKTNGDEEANGAAREREAIL